MIEPHYRVEKESKMEKLKILLRSKLDECIDMLGISVTADRLLKVERADMEFVFGKLAMATEIMEQIEPGFNLVDYCEELKKQNGNGKRTEDIRPVKD